MANLNVSNPNLQTDHAGFSSNGGRTARARIAILQVLEELGESAGAQKIADMLNASGVELQARSIRFHLQRMDQEGLTTSTARHEGRQITDTGRELLSRNSVVNKVGFISSVMDDLGYRMTFEVKSGRGNVIANIVRISEADLSRAIHYMKPVFRAGLSMGDRIAVRMPGHYFGSHEVKRGKVILSTICSVTINGIFQKAGIPVISRFGGLVEMRGGTPRRFLEVTEYRGTSTDPHKMFIMSGMTDVNKFAATGNGIIGVSFREFPSAAAEKARKLVTRLRESNLNGVLAIGHPNRPLMDIRVSDGRTAMVTIDGLNPIAALHEAGIPLHLNPLSGLEEISEYVPFGDVAPMERRSTYVE
ncbi:MAG: DUF128 domain-containing protein [Chitinispirillaceae bacterium]|nr:DUF128 domain-containing protein [Chitinispirillaceae bacterium]